MRGLCSLSLVLLTAACASATRRDFKIPMKVLLLSPTNNTEVYPGLAFAQLAFAGQGIIYDTLMTKPMFDSGWTQSLSLTAVDGSPRYQAVVLATGSLAVEISPDHWVSTLGESQWAELLDYQKNFGVRTDWQPVNVVADNASITSEFNWNGVAASSAEWQLTGISSVCNFIGTATVTKVTPILRFAESPAVHSPGDPHAAAIFKFEDGTEEMHFFFIDPVWEPRSSGPLSSAWIPWLFRDMFMGLRRMNFLVQLDDLFAQSPVWNVAELRPGNDSEPQYRCTADDMANLAKRQQEWHSVLPAGSKIVVSFPFNGFYADTSPGADPLYEYSRDFGRQKFYMLSHTWEHINLNVRTYSEAKFDFQSNIDFVNNVWYADGQHFSKYSSKSAITGEISGLENGEALRAMWDVGIRYLVGDNSVAKYRPDNWHHGWYTTMQTNGFDGMLILPRQATNIFFDCTHDVDSESRYNFMYSAELGQNLTLTEIVEKDVRYMMNDFEFFRKDPFMMHQANIAKFAFNGRNTSLLDLWVSEFVKVYAKTYTFPLLSLKQDDLGQSFVDRRSRDTCGITARLVIENCAATKIALFAEKYCTAALTGVHSSAFGNGEQYGPDYNLFVPLKANEETLVPLDTPIEMPNCNPLPPPITTGVVTPATSGTTADAGSTSPPPVVTTGQLVESTTATTATTAVIEDTSKKAGSTSLGISPPVPASVNAATSRISHRSVSATALLILLLFLS